MTKPSHSAVQPHPSTLWARSVALAGLLLILIASSVQAAHIHGEWFPQHDTQLRAHTGTQPGGQPESPLTGGDGANCPLCIAMHSAMAVTHVQQPAPSVAIAAVPARLVERIEGRPLHFSLFGRPPPVSA